MPTARVCPHGHRWKAPAGPSPTPARCPVCGEPEATLPPAGERTPSDLREPTDVTTLPASGRPGASVRPDVPGYEVLEELGRGGMGVVYKARHVRLNRLVALKMIRAGAAAGDEERERFRREAEAVAALHHPNIVQIHEVGEAGGLPFFALEFMEGGSLAEQLRRQPPSCLQAAALVETLARAVQHAHQRGVLHRDLKPSNVLLSAACGLAGSASLEGAVPKIADFGLAKRLDAPGQQTQTGAVIGTPSYIAPEQASGHVRQVGPAADVYALGAILYECLTGRPPFQAATSLDTVLQVLNDEPVPPRQRAAKVPRDLETICLKCLHKDPGRRYGSAQELADDLRRFLEWQPIKARRVGRLERTARWLLRRPAAVLAGLLVVAVLAAAAGGYALWHRPRNAPEVKVEYAADLVYRRGVPEGVGALSEPEARAAVRAFRLHLVQGRVEGIDVLERGAAARATESWSEVLGLAAVGDSPRREALYRFRNEQGHVRRQEACDSLGRPLWSLQWQSPSRAVLIDQRGSVDREILLSPSWSEDGWLTSVQFLDEQGRPVARRDVTCDPQGRLLRADSDDADGKRATDRRGVARIEYRRDPAGKLVEATSWKVTRRGELILWKRQDEQEHVVEEANLTHDGEARTWPEGHHRRTTRYDARGRPIEDAYFGQGGKPVVVAGGFHRSRTRYDDRGKELERAHFGPDGEPAFRASDLAFRVLCHFDERGNETEQLVLGPTGRPRNNKAGWARRQQAYDFAGALSERALWRADPQGQLRLWKRENPQGLVLEEASLTADGRPTPFDGGHYRWKGRYDSWGNQVEGVFLGPGGEPVVSPGNGYHRWVSRDDARGRTLEQVHYDLEGKPAYRSDDGAFRLLWRYDDRGNEVEELILGPNGRPRNNNSGWARRRNTWNASGQVSERAFWKADPEGRLKLWKREDGKEHVLEQVNLTADGRPQAWDGGHHRWITRYDSRGHEVEAWLFGPDGKPMDTTYGYHHWVARKDEKDRPLEWAHFNAAGEPAFRAADGCFRELLRYDSRGSKVEILRLGPNGRPQNSKDGWARQHNAYGPSGALAQRTLWKADRQGQLLLWRRQDGRGRPLEQASFGPDGRPLLQKEGYHRITFRYDARGKTIERAYFGLKGQPVAAI